jgi:hypothetical protein
MGEKLLGHAIQGIKLCVLFVEVVVWHELLFLLRINLTAAGKS